VKVHFLEQGWADYLHWQGADPKLLERINALIRDAARSPFRGVGKPEPLKGEWSGWWSRRISAEHRLVYRCSGSGTEQRLEIAQCRYQH
jgi:toxin YoeB